MRYSRLLGKTLREAPQTRRSESYALLHRAGYIRQMGHGLFTLFSFSPLPMSNAKEIPRTFWGQVLMQVWQMMHSVEPTLWPFCVYSVIWISMGQFFSQAMQSVHPSATCLTLVSEKRAPILRNDVMGHRYLQNALLSLK